ncbi:uncharacterized protein LOC126879629 isoform X4 [Diabrotica virgifera virgifera]|uniref:Uncharacterized protein LOC114339059 isoform X3 n=1 Tax=Diabrotica virgifera virgifera TaxID=50390 RepID=A0A6P7GJV1_DIAVI|nr:uncharacterized protein LOC126879629 isoform X4 [Diabrotica virgifera virgifera]
MWMIIFSWCAIVTFVMTLIFCACWRKKTVKNLTNSRRSLPDIPSEQITTVNWDPTDNSSEHYATLGQYQNAAKRHTIANGVDQRPSISQHSSISQNDDNFSPYERVKYDKINNSTEHPYAQVQPNTSRPILVEENNGSSEERINLLRSEINIVDSSPTPARSRRSSAHSNGGLDIPAASAVAGVVAASPELPYMTPPVTQANFSGDSQDSSKGYTSISVREPLANIIAQTNEMKKTKREFVDPHYSTVSDDSDDVYTTIPDPNNPIYASESETYARIPPLPITVEVEMNPPPPAHLQIQQPNIEDEVSTSPPQPPPVDSLRQVKAHNQTKTHSHSRQASSSSSIANLGSPKPEKRQANSPLPPPPAVSNFDFHIDKPQSIRNLDDLYAKVHKTKKEDANLEKVEKRSVTPESTNVGSIRSSLESKLHEKRYKDHNYETLKKSPRRTSDPGYEKIKSNNDPGYASINGPESVPSSDPGYEVLKDRAPSETDPNYEELRHRTSNASDSSAYTKIKDLKDGYSVVKKNNTLSVCNAIDEPNYESMQSEHSIEPNYEGSKSNSSESDPNYESVNHNDPNYESVKDLDDPPYERLDEDSSRTNSELSSCDRLKKMESEKNDTSESSNSIGKSSSEKTDPPYEQLNNDTDLETPGYEKIGAKSPITNSISDCSRNLTDPTNIHDEDGIFQITKWHKISNV